MLPQGSDLLLRGALEDAGLAFLPLSERRRVGDAVANRLRRFGVERNLHNWGGVLCGRAVHRGCCQQVGDRRLQRFSDDLEGVRRLVDLCCVYTGVRPVEGFRSELRTDGFFGPSDEAARTFQDLSAGWAGLESEFGAARLRGGFTKTSYEAWIAFRDKWQSGDEDTTALSAMVADLNVTRQNLGRERMDIRPPEITQTSTALKTAAKTDAAARAVTTVAADAARGAASATVHAWGDVPLSVKLGAAVVAILATVLAVFRVTR